MARRRNVRKLLKKIEAALAAVAFAEEGEVEAAREMLADEGRPGGADRKAARPAPRRAIPRPKIARLP
jgi:hypothetical protein